MGLKRNILANYASQIYVTLIGIVMVPMYVRYMGAEAYGLVGFFAMLQAWFQLLDMGLTQTVARESARYRGKSLSPIEYRHLVRALEGLFLIVALIGGIAMLAGADAISTSWLQAQQLLQADVETAVQLMAVIVSMRWMSGLYRGIVGGAERLVWLSRYNVLMATLRFAGVLPILIYVNGTPTVFFGFQCVIAALELLGLKAYASRLLPVLQHAAPPLWDWRPLKPVLKFSLTIAFTSLVMVLITQTDKLLLSQILSLSDYGYFTLAVLVASGVNLVNGPIGSAIMPRMARLDAEHRHSELIHVYRSATQLVSICAATAMTTVVFNAENILWSWTGDRLIAVQAAHILILYTIGNGILAVSAFPFYLQYAKGDLRLHLLGNAIFLVILIPVLFWATRVHGAEGAGYAWLVANAIIFVAWLPFVHRRFEPKLNSKWYSKDVFIIYFSALLAGKFFEQILPPASGRLMQFSLIILFGMLVLASSVAASSVARFEIMKKYQAYSGKK